MKVKKCKICKESFEPLKPLQMVCGFRCGLDYSRGQMEKNKKRIVTERKKELKAKLKTKSDHLRELQTIFNKFIRLRDKDMPCISCGTCKEVKYDAGHYVSVGSSPALRFNEDNVHKQCSNYCNKNQHGNIVAYRFHLIDRIGIERVEKLEASRSEPKQYSIPEIEELKSKYKLLIKEYSI
jgi:hypothetical protein